MHGEDDQSEFGEGGPCVRTESRLVIEDDLWLQSEEVNIRMVLSGDLDDTLAVVSQVGWQRCREEACRGVLEGEGVGKGLEVGG